MNRQGENKEKIEVSRFRWGFFLTNLHQEILFTRCGEEVDCTQVKSEIKTTTN